MWFIVILLMLKYWPITLLLIGLAIYFIWRVLQDSESYASYSYSESYPHPEGYDGFYENRSYDSNQKSSFRETENKKYNENHKYDDPYDFGPTVSSSEMDEHAAWLREEDPETYRELDLDE